MSGWTRYGNHPPLATTASSATDRTVRYLQPIGNTTIFVTDDEYGSGYQVGYLQYKLDYKSNAPTEMDIYALIIGVITSVRHSGRYHAGYVTGWIAALLEGQQLSRTVPVLVEAAVEEVNV